MNKPIIKSRKIGEREKEIYEKYISTEKAADLSQRQIKRIFKRSFLDFQKDKITIEDFCFLSGVMAVYPSKKNNKFDEKLFQLLVNTYEMKFYLKDPRYTSLYRQALRDLFDYFGFKKTVD